MAESIFICCTCGHPHEGFSFAVDFPDMYNNLPVSERGDTMIGSDQCVIDEEWFFIRGCLEIPILGTDECFLWGLWASVKEESYNAISESWKQEGRERLMGPFKGRLANSLSEYPETLNLKLRLLIQPVGARPLFVLEDEHPFTSAQQNGLSRAEATELASILIHTQQPMSKSRQ